MALPALVLVHGGAHAGDCWDLTVDEIRRLEPDLTVLAVDLPGRRGKPGDLWTLYPDSSRIPMEKVPPRDIPDEVSRTWILTLRDHTHSEKEQRESMEALGGVQTLIPIDTCHGLMVSEPKRLAEIPIERCRRYE